MAKMNDPEATRLPIKLDATSNGEFSLIQLDATARRANELAQRAASENARRLGLSRRAFMLSATGAASTLLAFNQANAAAGRDGGYFELDQTTALDADAAA
ncbi:MAG: amidohydrolase, partial [Alphaproteobacteria bacterium]